MNASESTQARWGQWWRMASAHARLRREVKELRTRLDKIELRVDRMQITVQDDLAKADAALEKMRHDFDYALSQNRRHCDMYRIGWWHDLAPGGRSRPTVEFFSAGEFEKLMQRLTELRTGGNHVVVEVAGIGEWKRVAL